MDEPDPKAEARKHGEYFLALVAMGIEPIHAAHMTASWILAQHGIAIQPDDDEGDRPEWLQ